MPPALLVTLSDGENGVDGRILDGLVIPLMADDAEKNEDMLPDLPVALPHGENGVDGRVLDGLVRPLVPEDADKDMALPIEVQACEIGVDGRVLYGLDMPLVVDEALLVTSSDGEIGVDGRVLDGLVMPLVVDDVDKSLLGDAGQFKTGMGDDRVLIGLGTDVDLSVSVEEECLGDLTSCFTFPPLVSNSCSDTSFEEG